MITPEVKDTKVIFGECRLSYVHLFEKYSFDGRDEGKYSCNILIPKEEKATVKAIQQAIDNAYKAAKLSKWHGAEPKKFESPLHDGDEKDDEAFHGCYYLNAKSSTRPGIVNRKRESIVDEEEMYSGVWANCSVTFFGFDTSGNKGISCGLNNLMKVKDGEYLGGRSSADTDFGGIDIDDEEEDL